MPNRRQFAAASLAMLMLLGGCTVQPLYGTGPAGGSAISGQVSIAAVDTRVGQQVRNRLVFLLNGNAAEPANAPFSATLNVTTSTRGLLKVTGGDGESTASRVTATGTIVVTREDDGQVVLRETRRADASFDNTTQTFANSRAQRDAENRAAEELADRLRTAILVALAEQ